MALRVSVLKYIEQCPTCLDIGCFPRKQTKWNGLHVWDCLGERFEMDVAGWYKQQVYLGDRQPFFLVLSDLANLQIVSSVFM